MKLSDKEMIKKLKAAEKILKQNKGNHWHIPSYAHYNADKQELVVTDGKQLLVIKNFVFSDKPDQDQSIKLIKDGRGYELSSTGESKDYPDYQKVIDNFTQKETVYETDLNYYKQPFSNLLGNIILKAGKPYNVNYLKTIFPLVERNKDNVNFGISDNINLYIVDDSLSISGANFTYIVKAIEDIWE